jgi:niacin transporter
MPIKIIIGPASFTLASHVPVMFAMFFSPFTALFVSLGTTVGFALAIPVPTIWLRALTHTLFSVLGALYLKKRPETLGNFNTCLMFNFVLGLVHAVAEVAIVAAYYSIGMEHLEMMKLLEFLLLIGLGTVIHSMVDYQIAMVIAQKMQNIITIPTFEVLKKKNEDNK